MDRQWRCLGKGVVIAVLFGAVAGAVFSLVLLLYAGAFREPAGMYALRGVSLMILAGSLPVGWLLGGTLERSVGFAGHALLVPVTVSALTLAFAAAGCGTWGFRLPFDQLLMFFLPAALVVAGVAAWYVLVE